MKRHIKLHPEAVEEARLARLWYEERSPLAAEGFVKEMMTGIDAILAAPDRWPTYIHQTRRYLFRRYPYFIVYRSVGETIQILAFAHGHRRPGYWIARR